MVIKGTDINTFRTMSFAPQNRGNVFSAAGNSFARRFDTLELSEFFKSSQDGKKVSDIRKMMSEAENKESTRLIADGTAGFAYMEMSLVREAMRAETNIAKFNYYAEEKSYYQGLLNGSTDTRAVYDDYKYIRPESGDIDREQVMQALADVQGRIDKLINAEYEGKTDFETYNKCADSVAKAFCSDGGRLALDEKSYDKLFGKIEANEENYVQKWEERAKSLWERYDALKSRRDSGLEKMNPQYADAVKKADITPYGNSFEDILSFIAELK